MQHTSLFIISGDPLEDPRPAEALRIATGVAAWQKTRVHLYLDHPTVRALTHHAGELLEEHQFRHCLPELANPGQPLLLPVGTASGMDPDITTPHLQEITEHDLAALAAQSHCVLYF